MDNSNSNISRNKQNEFLGVNKIGKNIRKSPLHQPNFSNNISNSGANYSNNNNGARKQPQAQVYNISKNDFRNIVQQLTSSPRPPTNPPKHPNMRLQRFRPPPLSPINRHLMPHVVATQVPMAPPESHFNNSNSNSNGFGGRPTQFGWPSPKGMLPPQFGYGQANWTTPALSPISAYVQQLQSCIGEEGPRPGLQPMQSQMTGQIAGHPGLQQQFHGYMHAQSPFQLNVPALPSPGTNGHTILPSPTSQFPSPPTPRSSYPLLSQGSPNFAYSPFGFFGAGPQPTLSPGISFPLSPSGFFPISSPRWRDQ